MSNTIYSLTQQLHTLIQEKAEKHGLGIKLKDEYGIDGHGKIYQNAEFVNGGVPKDLISAIQAPQIRAILLAFKEVLGGLNIKIKECGDGFYAIVDEKYIFSLDRNLGFEGYKREFKKPRNKNETYKNLLQNDKFGLQKRIFASKKELEIELKKYYLDVNDRDSAEALCNKWLDGLEPLIDRELETVLTELLEILKTL